ncbi:MAG: hypothetical protein ACKVW3_14540 [Phycisphaerales bacterium]
MRIFLDSSVVLAAFGSHRGASLAIFRGASENNWSLLTSAYVIEEVLANLSDLHETATVDWAKLRPELLLVDDVLTLDRAAVFEPAKDRPVLFTALAWAEVLLTLDRSDFGAMIGSTFYGLSILTPGCSSRLNERRVVVRKPADVRGAGDGDLFRKHQEMEVDDGACTDWISAEADGEEAGMAQRASR